MARLIIVDDEPQARRYLKAMIQRCRPDLEIIGEAEDGSEALDLARKTQPEIVVTDVRMPGMDGLELALRLRKEQPESLVIIASGHDEFEYARSALKAGVIDYLLKPIRAAQIKSVLDGVTTRISAALYARRTAALRDIVSGAPAPRDEERRRRLPEGQYSVAVLRLGPPPSRFSSIVHPGSQGGTPRLGAFSALDAINVWILPGRDGSELLFVRSNALTARGEFERSLLAAAEGSERPYRALAFAADLFPLSELGTQVADLHRAIDDSAVPGHALVIRGAPARGGSAPTSHPGANSSPLDAIALEGRVDFLLSESRYGELERLVRELSAQWDREERPLVQALAQTRRLLDLVRKRAAGTVLLRDEEFDATVERAVVEAADYRELGLKVVEVIDSITRRPLRAGGNVDAPAFFASIKRQIEENISREITLQSTCKALSISQTYLSRLFRKYEGVSFHVYLTRARIEAAKRLMAESPSIPLKNVAALTGYQDQSYFSRVFKSIVGVPPSEYMGATFPRAD